MDAARRTRDRLLGGPRHRIAERLLAAALATATAVALGSTSSGAGVLLFASDPAYVAGLADRLVARRPVAGGSVGTLAGVDVAIPSLDGSIDEVLATLRTLAASSGCSTVVAVVEGGALGGLALPGDFVLASEVRSITGGSPIQAERRILETMRLAGADAGFFEVPDTRPGAKGGRAPRILIAPCLSAPPGARATGIRESAAAVGAEAADELDGTVARALDRSGLRWGVVEALVGEAGERSDPILAERAVANISRFVLAYLKATNSAEPPTPSAPVAARPSRGLFTLRESPNVGAPAVATVARGSRYQVIESTPDQKWNRIQLEDGRGGWALGSSLEREPVVVYTIAPGGGAAVLVGREYDIDPHDATPDLIARAVCHPDDARLLVPNGFRGVSLGNGIDSVSADIDTVSVFFGSKTKAAFRADRGADWEGFLAGLVYSLTSLERIRIVRTRMTSAESPFVSRAYRREDFLAYWPDDDLREAEASHPESVVRERARAVLAGRWGRTETVVPPAGGER